MILYAIRQGEVGGVRINVFRKHYIPDIVCKQDNHESKNPAVYNCIILLILNFLICARMEQYK